MEGFDVILLCILMAIIFFTIGYLCGSRVWYKNKIDGLAFLGPFDLKVMLSISKPEAEAKKYIVLQIVPPKEGEKYIYGEDQNY